MTIESQKRTMEHSTSELAEHNDQSRGKHFNV